MLWNLFKLNFESYRELCNKLRVMVAHLLYFLGGKYALPTLKLYLFFYMVNDGC